MRGKLSVSVNCTDTSIVHIRQLDIAIPAYKIAALSSGELVRQFTIIRRKNDGKIFFVKDADKLNEEVSRYKNIPLVSNVTQQQVRDNYY